MQRALTQVLPSQLLRGKLQRVCRRVPDTSLCDSATARKSEMMLLVAGNGSSEAAFVTMHPVHT